MRTRTIWPIGLIASISAVSLLVPAVADAGIVQTGFQGSVQINAGSGETNAFTAKVGAADGPNSTVSVTDDGAPLTGGTGCTTDLGTGTVSCTVPNLNIVFVQLGDMNDGLSVDNRVSGVQFTITAGDGNDSVDVGREGEVCLDGGTGDDLLTISTPSAACIVSGGPGLDALTGSGGQDRLYGGDDVDSVNGGGGGDYVYGDAGDDTVHGGPGADIQIDGGEGNDHLYGDQGADSIQDAAGDDTVDGGTGRDVFSTSFLNDSGNDTYVGGQARDRFTYLCPACSISLDGTPNDGRVNKGESDDIDAEMISTPSHTVGEGGEPPPHDYGTGRDVLVGDGGANTIIGHRGDDRIDGGLGSDRLIAGEGDDRVVANDGTADTTVDCGPGIDVAIVDALDSPVDCEHVTVALGS